LQLADRQVAALEQQRAELDVAIQDLKVLRATAADELRKLADG
jgi:peptidoglycan hydrolase CwlO-like protein